MRTQNTLDSNAKTVSITLLNARVADTIDLALAAKQAHWNVRGAQFIAVHEMLDKLRATLDEHVDTMAERITALGGVALGTTQATAKATKLKPYPTDIHAVPDHLAALAERLALLGGAVRSNIGDAEEAGDAATADILTAASRDLDKWLWFVEAHQPA
ncbi:MAG: DNA starvation/stationary phase protection protein Dps [Acetobacteraceae bacterium]|nr:DNA starvation/stationary phase protection protein Dps [Acetobacteraceae bacterium]